MNKGDVRGGDTVGWINRGLDWKDIVDTPAEYSVTIVAYHDDLEYPMVVNVAPRRLQEFQIEPGEEVSVQVDEYEPKRVHDDDKGLVTIYSVRIDHEQGTHITMEK